MYETRQLCDRCKLPGAKPHGIFKYRKTDAAGSGEDWYDSFDLCGECAHIVLNRLFAVIDKELALTTVTKCGVKTRVE